MIFSKKGPNVVTLLLRTLQCLSVAPVTKPQILTVIHKTLRNTIPANTLSNHLIFLLFV